MSVFRRVLVIAGALGVTAGFASMGWRYRSITNARAEVQANRQARASLANEQLELEGFAIDKTEVTVAQYHECVKAGGCTEPGKSEYCNWEVKGRETHPINCVDHVQASAFCSWIGRRLPTKNEWELAACGRDGRSYPWPGHGSDGKECLDRDAQYGPGAGRKLLSAPQGTCPVDAHPQGATERGVLGMGGNVSEWTSTQDGNPWPPSNRWVNLGASWPNRVHGREIRCGETSLAHAPTHRSAVLGFRCATREPPSVWAELMQTEVQLARSSTTAMP